MSALYLKDEFVKRNIQGIWAGNPRLSFYGKLRRSVKFYKEFCIRKAQENRAKEADRRTKLDQAVTILQAAPGDPLAQAALLEAFDYLSQVEARKLEGQRLRSRLKWKQKGDQCTKEFFKAHKARSSASHITALEDISGQVHTNQSAIGEICQANYQRLYLARVATAETVAAEAVALECVQDCVPSDMKTELKQPLSLAELKQAVDEMKPGKAPGPDGTILEFYKQFWECIGEDFHRMITESVAQGRLPAGVTHGMITLLHKGGTRQALTNWRPITLLNMGYKIYAKALQL